MVRGPDDVIAAIARHVMQISCDAIEVEVTCLGRLTNQAVTSPAPRAPDRFKDNRRAAVRSNEDA